MFWKSQSRLWAIGLTKTKLKILSSLMISSVTIVGLSQPSVYKKIEEKSKEFGNALSEAFKNENQDYKNTKNQAEQNNSIEQTIKEGFLKLWDWTKKSLELTFNSGKLILELLKDTFKDKKEGIDEIKELWRFFKKNSKYLAPHSKEIIELLGNKEPRKITVDNYTGKWNE